MTEIESTPASEGPLVGGPLVGQAAIGEVPVVGLPRLIGWNAVGLVGPQLISFAIAPFLVDSLGLDRFGIWAVFLTLLAIFGGIDGGLSVSLARFFTLHVATRNRAASGRLAVSVLLAFVAVSSVTTSILGLAGPTIADALNVPSRLHGDVSAVLWSAGPLLAVGLAGNVFLALLQAHNRYNALAAVLMAGAASYGASAVLLLEAGGGLGALVVATALQFLVILVSGAWMTRHSICLQRPLLLLPHERSELWRFSSRMQLAGAMGLLNNQADALVVAILLPVRYVGLFAIGARAASTVLTVPLWAMTPMSVRLTRAFGTGDVEHAVREFRPLNETFQRIVSTCGLVVAVGAGFAVTVWFGAGYSEAGIVCVILAMGYVVHVASAPLSCLVRAIGDSGLEMRYGLFTATLNLALTVPLAIAFGLYGVVAATAASLVLGTIWFGSLVRRRVPARLGKIFLLRQWVLGLVAGAAVAVVEALVGGWHHPRLVGMVVVGAIAGVPLLVLGYAQVRTGTVAKESFVAGVRRFLSSLHKRSPAPEEQ